MVPLYIVHVYEKRNICYNKNIIIITGSFEDHLFLKPKILVKVTKTKSSVLILKLRNVEKDSGRLASLRSKTHI